jgi:hypothetical protein
VTYLNCTIRSRWVWVMGLPEVDGRIDFVDRLPSVGDDPGERTQEIAPDHALVTAKFDL